MFNIICSKLLNYKSVISERSNTLGRLSGKFSGLKQSLVALLYKRADKVIAVSNGVADCLTKELGLAPEKVTVLNNPVDLERIREQSRAIDSGNTISAKIIAMGRLVNSKGFEDLIHAYAKSELDCGLVILGHGPNRRALLKLISHLGLNGQIELLGFVSNPYALLQQAEIFVLSSHLEGFPNALVEAMALAKAVIATDCKDGPREILGLNTTLAPGKFETTEFGLMVAVSDCQAIAKAMRLLVQDAAFRHSLATNGQNRVKQFSKYEFYRKYCDVLAQTQNVRVNTQRS